jgi:hypothetical protein
MGRANRRGRDTAPGVGELLASLLGVANSVDAPHAGHAIVHHRRGLHRCRRGRARLASRCNDTDPSVSHWLSATRHTHRREIRCRRCGGLTRWWPADPESPKCAVRQREPKLRARPSSRSAKDVLVGLGDQVGDGVRLGDQRRVIGLMRSDMGAHPLGHELLGLRVDHPVLVCQ